MNSILKTILIGTATAVVGVGSGFVGGSTYKANNYDITQNSEYQQVIEQNTALTDQNASLNNELNSNKLALSSAIADKEKLSNEKHELELQISELNTTIENANTKIENLQSEISEKQTQIEQLNADILSKQSQIESLQDDAEANATQIAELQQEVSELTTNVQELESDISDANSQIETLQQQIQSLTTQVENLQSTVTEKEQEIYSLNYKMNTLVNSIARIKINVSDYYLTSDDYRWFNIDNKILIDANGLNCILEYDVLDGTLRNLMDNININYYYELNGLHYFTGSNKLFEYKKDIGLTEIQINIDGSLGAFMGHIGDDIYLFGGNANHYVRIYKFNSIDKTLSLIGTSSVRYGFSDVIKFNNKFFLHSSGGYCYLVDDDELINLTYNQDLTISNEIINEKLLCADKNSIYIVDFNSNTFEKKLDFTSELATAPQLFYVNDNEYIMNCNSTIYSYNELDNELQLLESPSNLSNLGKVIYSTENTIYFLGRSYDCLYSGFNNSLYVYEKMTNLFSQIKMFSSSVDYNVLVFDKILIFYQSSKPTPNGDSYIHYFNTETNTINKIDGFLGKEILNIEEYKNNIIITYNSTTTLPTHQYKALLDFENNKLILYELQVTLEQTFQ